MHLGKLKDRIFIRPLANLYLSILGCAKKGYFSVFSILNLKILVFSDTPESQFQYGVGIWRFLGGILIFSVCGFILPYENPWSL